MEDEPSTSRKGRGPDLCMGPVSQVLGHHPPLDCPTPLVWRHSPGQRDPGRVVKCHRGSLCWVTGLHCSRPSAPAQNPSAAPLFPGWQGSGTHSPQPAHLENGALGSHGAAWAESSRAGRHRDALERREAWIKGTRAGG